MKNKDIQKMSKTELNNNYIKLKKDLFNLRFQKTNGQLTNPAKINELKKLISKTLTKINIK
ncbi:MAG: 50S ribosomal protein L29 [Candidatus Pelagibacter sp. TMED64]|nr:50S ribosomal protein L29 [Candidatus Pelagibacter sp.]OUU67084.1 MAG: 50S ribosomal protein L29 [Candidatus Pelagibacter sp. TMED64]|tara:strand:+ start:5975 stop:6157 length:183 start_codon:yes stop_codon:yes gene_type:complete